MEIVIQSITDAIVVILNYQPLVGLGISIKLVTLILAWIGYRLWKSR